MPPKGKDIFTAVRDEEHWKEITAKENKKIVVVDLYYPWFGRCEVLDEALKAIYMNLEEPEKKLQFFNLDLTKLHVLKDQPKSSAKPRFLIYLVRIFRSGFEALAINEPSKNTGWTVES